MPAERSNPVIWLGVLIAVAAGLFIFVLSQGGPTSNADDADTATEAESAETTDGDADTPAETPPEPPVEAPIEDEPPVVLSPAGEIVEGEIATEPQDTDEPAVEVDLDQLLAPALVLAAEAGEVDRVRMLLRDDAWIDEPGPGGRTALLAAAANGKLAVVFALLDGGADPLATDDNDQTARDLALARDDEVGRRIAGVLRSAMSAGDNVGAGTGEPAPIDPTK